MEDDLAKLFERLDRWRESHHGRNALYRLGWVLAGFAVLLTGLAMVVLPGPAVVVIPLGLAMLSLEFAWAERLLETSVQQGVKVRRKLPVPTAVLVALGLAGMATSLVALIFL